MAHGSLGQFKEISEFRDHGTSHGGWQGPRRTYQQIPVELQSDQKKWTHQLQDGSRASPFIQLPFWNEWVGGEKQPARQFEIFELNQFIWKDYFKEKVIIIFSYQI